MNERLKKIENILNTKLSPTERKEYIKSLNEISHDLDEYKRITDLHLLDILSLEDIEKRLKLTKILEKHLKIFIWSPTKIKNLHEIDFEFIDKFVDNEEAEFLIKYLKEKKK